MNGSTRAEVQEWTVDLEKKCAVMEDTRRRQLTPMSPKYNPAEHCQTIARLVASNDDHPWLKWSPDKSRVTVNIGLIVPSGHCQQTEIARRKRFRAKLAEMLQAQGWEQASYNKYVRKQPEGTS